MEKSIAIGTYKRTTVESVGISSLSVWLEQRNLGQARKCMMKVCLKQLLKIFELIGIFACAYFVIIGLEMPIVFILRKHLH